MARNEETLKPIRVRRFRRCASYSPQLYQSHYGCYGFGRS